MDVLEAPWWPAAAYLYVLHLDEMSLAWEYLRRNPEYRADWARFKPPIPARAARNWGLRSLEDPARDAREAQPRWQPHPPPVIRIERDDETETPPAFSIWNMPGCRSLFHDGRQILLDSRRATHTLHIAFTTNLSDGDPFVFLVSPAACRQEKWRAISHFNGAISKPSPGFGASAFKRPSRATLTHMHALQALDAVLAGASHRQIAAALYGEAVIATQWHPDSELRAQVRYLIRRARMLMTGGYRRLLDSANLG